MFSIIQRDRKGPWRRSRYWSAVDCSKCGNGCRSSSAGGETRSSYPRTGGWSVHID